jgi:hypothetical protein
MPLCCAIYGYECSRPASFPDFELTPRTQDLPQARDWARDKETYHLTAVIVGEGLTDELAFQLEAILSFVEHLDVVVTSPKAHDGSDPFSTFQETIPTHGRHDGGGATLMSDVFFNNSRADFVRKCLSHVRDDTFCDATQFRNLFFKKVETFRQRRPFLEISYFLLYSGLEAHARAVTGDKTNRNSSEPIWKLLTSYGFDVSIERPADLKRSISTYTHLRNALFHNNELETVVNVNGTQVSLKIIDYFFNLLQLSSLVVMKAISFDDGHVNWNSWIDRAPFK